MTTYKLLLLPGDGIGVETMAEVERVIAFFNAHGKELEVRDRDRPRRRRGVRQARRRRSPTRRWPRRRQPMRSSSAPSAGPKWDKVPYAVRPEAGLLRLRKDLDLFANLRPAICYPALADASSLKRELVEGLDILILRELTGRHLFRRAEGDRHARERREARRRYHDLHDARDRAHRQDRVRSRPQAPQQGAFGRKAERDEARRALERGRHRDPQEPMRRTSNCEHILADNCAMQLVRNPKQFDVVVSDNLFGDVLSDEAAMLTGSLGMLPSASLGAPECPRPAAQGALRAGARFGARHRRQGPRQPDRNHRLVCAWRCAIRSTGSQGSRHARQGRSPTCSPRATARATSCSRT